MCELLTYVYVSQGQQEQECMERTIAALGGQPGDPSSLEQLRVWVNDVNRGWSLGRISRVVDGKIEMEFSGGGGWVAYWASWEDAAREIERGDFRVAEPEEGEEEEEEQEEGAGEGGEGGEAEAGIGEDRVGVVEATVREGAILGLRHLAELVRRR